MSRRTSLAILTIVIAAGAAARFATLGVQSFDSGETITAYRVLHSGLFATLQQVATTERSPPLYYLLAWGWSHPFGTGEVALRSLSAIFGTLTIPFAYLAGRELATRAAGICAALLVAANPYFFWYSQEARSYALVVMLVALGLFCFARARRDPSPRALAAWAAVSALALCSHYFAIFVVGPEALLLLGAQPRTRAKLLAVAATGAAGLALVPLALRQEGSGRANSFTHVPVLDRGATAAVKFFSGEGPVRLKGLDSLSAVQIAAGLAGLVLALAAIALAARRGRGRERRAVATAGLLAACGFALPLAMALGGADYVDPRNLIGALLPLLVAMGVGCSLVRAPRAGAAVLGGALSACAAIIAATAFIPALQRNDWRSAAQLIGDTRVPRVVVADAPAGQPLGYYLGPLSKLTSATFPDGVVTRRVDVLSAGHPVHRIGHGFFEVSKRMTPQGWRLDEFESALPREVQPSWVGGTRVLDWRSAALVEDPQGIPRAS